MKPIHIIVDSRIRLRTEELTPELDTDLRAAFVHANPAHAKLKRMGYAAHKEPPAIKTWRYEGAEELTLPRGGMQRVRDVLTAHGRDWTVSDYRHDGDVELTKDIPVHRVNLRDYQAEALEAIVQRQNCIIRAPTGSGKTTTAIAIASHLQLGTLVIVWNGALMEQWVERLQSELGLAKGDIGIVRGQKTKLRPVTIAMQQTLARASEEKWRDLTDSFGVVICDEVQRFAASTFLKVIDRFPARYRIGVSADETRKDRKEFLIYDVFGSVAHEVKRRELEKRGQIVDVEVRIVPTDFRADWYIEQRKNPTVNPDFNRLVDEMTRDGARNSVALSFATTALEQEAGTLLVFSHRVDHCRSLDSDLASLGHRSKCMLGGAENEDEFVTAREGLKDGSVRVGVGTYQAIGTGHDIPTVTHGVVTTPIGGNRQFWGQVRGRLCRPHKDKARGVAYYLWDRHVFGLQPVKNLAAWNDDVRVLDGDQWMQAKKYIDREERRYGNP